MKQKTKQTSQHVRVRADHSALPSFPSCLSLLVTVGCASRFIIQLRDGASLSLSLSLWEMLKSPWSRRSPLFARKPPTAKTYREQSMQYRVKTRRLEAWGQAILVNTRNYLEWLSLESLLNADLWLPAACGAGEGWSEPAAGLLEPHSGFPVR